MFKRLLTALLVCLVALTLTSSGFAQTQAPAPKAPAAAAPEKPAATTPAPEEKPEIPKDKQTKLGLYVTSKEAYAMWQKDPEKIKVLDCRTPEEYAFVGHAPMAKNIPSKFMKYRWDAKKKSFVMQDNPRFVREVRKAFKKGDTIMVMCRSGGRSAQSVNKLAKAGFTNVYNIIDGFEGDKIKDNNSPQHGKRAKNGWRNSEVPWTYEMDVELIYLPYGQPKKKK